MTKPLLLCTDLDRTLLPNGDPIESPGARERFSRFTARPEVTLVYVSGRHKELVLDAINEFTIPVPDFVIGDVGTTIYSIKNGEWQAWPAWHQEIAPDWAGYDRPALEALFEDIESLTPQEDAKQNTFKLSYYTPEDIDRQTLLSTMRQRLDEKGVNASLIWSIDDIEHVGLLDLLPGSATKVHAIEFLVKEKGFSADRVVYAGDSGNDLPVLVSPINSVLVANAQDDVRSEALTQAKENKNENTLYLATGKVLGMNGNYSAGILEGVIHYLPETEEII
ncbi:MAG: HAD-IIB family hydrolase [Pseudomonadota bacterium]